MRPNEEYVLGTHDEEIARLGLQHRVWKPRATDAWRRAGFGKGQKILDVGCGPGYATLDLAQIVGEDGAVFALDKSRRFLDALESARAERSLSNITTMHLDLESEEIPDLRADGAWVRWVFAFVKDPRHLLSRIARALKGGGALVVHEYYDYFSWCTNPRSEAFEEFVRVVMTSWRAQGGEPDIGLQLYVWLKELGFTIHMVLPIIDIVPPSNFIWQWPKAFVHVNVRRLVDLGYLSEERAEEVERSFHDIEKTPGALMVTPGVMELIALNQAE
ncbi:MAG TPA: methyltransferase domain-containing protein [Bacteroidota bacterium]|nr:methyltransferase domain-containing protein [Bacteroidota bacterium]